MAVKEQKGTREHCLPLEEYKGENVLEEGAESKERGVERIPGQIAGFRRPKGCQGAGQGGGKEQPKRGQRKRRRSPIV